MNVRISCAPGSGRTPDPQDVRESGQFADLSSVRVVLYDIRVA